MKSALADPIQFDPRHILLTSVEKSLTGLWGLVPYIPQIYSEWIGLWLAISHPQLASQPMTVFDYTPICSCHLLLLTMFVSLSCFGKPYTCPPGSTGLTVSLGVGLSILPGILNWILPHSSQQSAVSFLQSVQQFATIEKWTFFHWN